MTAPRPAAPGRPRASLALVLRSALYLAGMVVSTLALAPVAILFLPLPYRWRYRVVVQWTWFNVWWLEVTCRLRHEVEGRENIPAQPTVILCKHQSTWETMVLQRYFSPQTWVLKRELLLVPLFGWGLATLKPIAIDRGAGKSALEQVLEQGARRLAEGIWVVVFPEGTRVPAGQRRRYKLGGAALAAHTGRPAVPVAHNSGDFWPRRSFVKYPGTIRLVIGPPIETRGRDPADVNREAEAWIEATVARLRAPYAGPVAPPAGAGADRPGGGGGRGSEIPDTAPRA